jgi:hypothetical protein
MSYFEMEGLPTPQLPGLTQPHRLPFYVEDQRLPTNSNSSASSGSSGPHLSNGKSSKHHGGFRNYSEYKSKVNSCG